MKIYISAPDANIGITVSSYPQFVRVPGYPVYYAPRVQSNYFFYDGMYWVYRNDNWYASYWYNGPWGQVAPAAVPLYVLRVPVRYYRERPARFSAWRADAPPRWGEVWGSEWEQRRSGWDRWNRAAVPAPAPLPVYQRQYAGARYPQLEQQPVLQGRYYRFQPREAVVRQYYEVQGVQRAQAAAPPRAQRAPKPPKEPKAYKEPKPPKPLKAHKEPKPPKAAKAHKESKPPKAGKEPKGEKEHKGGK